MVQAKKAKGGSPSKPGAETPKRKAQHMAKDMDHEDKHTHMVYELSKSFVTFVESFIIFVPMQLL